MISGLNHDRTLTKCPFCESKRIQKVEDVYEHYFCLDCGKHFGIINGKLSTLDKVLYGVWIPLVRPKEIVIWT
jgi:transposase-like protein